MFSYAPRSLPLRCIAAVFLLALMLLANLMPSSNVAAGGGIKKKIEPKVDAQFASYQKQLHNRFQEWDKNNDNILDKAELAKAFRGQNAKAYDDLPPPKTIVLLPKQAPLPKTAKPEVKSTSVMLASLPQAGLPVNLVLAELLAQPKSAPAVTTTPAEPKVITAPPINVNAFADVQFLQLLNRVKAGRITKKDYDQWADDYAQLLNRLVDNERDVKVAQQDLKKAKTPKERKQTQSLLVRQQKELQQVQTQLSAIPASVQQAFHLKR